MLKNLKIIGLSIFLGISMVVSDFADVVEFCKILSNQNFASLSNWEYRCEKYKVQNDVVENLVEKQTQRSALDNPIAYNTSAKGMAVIEANSGRLICSKNRFEKLKMASTTKVLTAITVIENCVDLDAKFTIDDRAVGIEGSSIYLRKGESLTARELLYGLMLRSGNDTAVALALHVSGSIPKFAELMNETAKKIGAVDSNFTNPHGLDDDNHYTTAYDLALISAYAIKNEIFKEIVSTKNIKITGYEEEYRYLSNKNKLLLLMENCVGIKTGFTKKAGRCFVSALEKDGAIYVCVVLACGPMFEESKEMLEIAKDVITPKLLLEPYSFVRQIDVIDGNVAKVKTYLKEGYSYPLLEQELSSVNIEYDLPETIKAPIKAEQVLGKAKVYYKNILLKEIDILSMENVECENVTEKIKNIIEKW